MERGKEFLRSIFGRDEEAALSRRDALAGLGLAGLLLATPKLLGSSAAEAKPLEPAPATKADDTQRADEATDLAADDTANVTDLSSQYWRRRRRRYWRRRYWRRRYWRPRYYRRRYWRRRYWRRRYRY